MLTWDWLATRKASELCIPDRRRVEVRVTAGDFAGNKVDAKPWVWTMNYGADTTDPAPPVLSSAQPPAIVEETFTNGSGAWVLQNSRSLRNYVRAATKPRADDASNNCLEILFMRSTSNFRIMAHNRPYNLMKNPLVSFECLVPKDLQINMLVNINGKMYEVKLTAPQARYPVIGEHKIATETPGWQRVDIDLLAMARTIIPKAKTFVVTSISFGTAAGASNPKNAVWRVDNFRIGGYGPARANFSWRSVDISGIKNYAVLLNQNPTATRTELKETLTTSLKRNIVKPGTWWLHVAARDGNKNWSRITHMPYTVKAK